MRLFMYMLLAAGLMGVASFIYGVFASRTATTDVTYNDNPSAATPATQEQPTNDAPAPPEPTQAPEDGTFTGKIADLPEKARDVLTFQPAETTDQVNSQSISERVYQNCGRSFGDYSGSDEFSGTIRVGAPERLGWTSVVWTVPSCDMAEKSQAAIFTFRISADNAHIDAVGLSRLLLAP